MKVACLLVALTAVASADDRCVIDKAPPPAPRAIAAPACHQPPKALAASLTKAITKDFSPSQPGATAKVVFPCDGLGPVIDEVIVETGNGHGGTLQVYRAKRSGVAYDVRGISYRGATMASSAAAIPFELARGRVALDVDRLRAATTARVSEVLPPAKPGQIALRSFGTSSQDFHIAIALRDGDGRVIERRFTGYRSTDDQDQFLGLLVAQDVLAPMLSLAASSAPVEAGDRALFADRFNATARSFDEPFSWWVKERYVELARYLGSPKVIAGLLTRMTVADPKDRSAVDTRRDALAALAAITGWDARTGVTEEQAAKQYLAGCR